jgi:hypothetical protein
MLPSATERPPVPDAAPLPVPWDVVEVQAATEPTIARTAAAILAAFIYLPNK